MIQEPLSWEIQLKKKSPDSDSQVEANEKLLWRDPLSAEASLFSR